MWDSGISLGHLIFSSILEVCGVVFALNIMYHCFFVIFFLFFLCAPLFILLNLFSLVDLCDFPQEYEANAVQQQVSRTPQKIIFKGLSLFPCFLVAYIYFSQKINGSSYDSYPCDNVATIPWLLGYSDLLLTNNGYETLSQKKGKTNKQTNKLRLQEILNMCALQVDVLKLEVTTLWGAARLLCLVSVQIYTINNKIKLTGFGSLFCLHR